VILLAELLGEHLELEKLGARLLDVVNVRVPDAAKVAALRWELCRAFVDHWGREDQLIYDRLLASGDAEAVAAAWEFRREFGALREEMRLYVTEWPVDRIAREWEAFRDHTFALRDRIDARRAQEESVLYTHARRVIGRRAA